MDILSWKTTIRIIKSNSRTAPRITPCAWGHCPNSSWTQKPDVSLLPCLNHPSFLLQLVFLGKHLLCKEEASKDDCFNAGDYLPRPLLPKKDRTRHIHTSVGFCLVGFFEGLKLVFFFLAAQFLIDRTGEAEAEDSVTSCSRGAFALLHDHPHLHNHISE